MKGARLVLEDGSVFPGVSFGYPSSTSGEVVFNTGMVGYPEALTDPSYKGQILMFTYPLIGNYGIPHSSNREGIQEFFESSKIHVQGVVVSEQSSFFSHWNAAGSLSDWLWRNKIPGISGIDTRALTQKIREKGVMLGKIIVDGNDIDWYNPDVDNVVAKVSIDEVKTFGKGNLKILAVDCGMKNNILRLLLNLDVTIKVVPWDYNIKGQNYDGLFVSNGPGNPKLCTQTISTIQQAMIVEKPIFGICLGHQLLALAAGGNTFKLKYGHRGQNQPCSDRNNRCFVTAQNHGFAVDTSSLSNDWGELFRNLNDGTNEGIEHMNKPFFSLQFHPEGSCGPMDTSHYFESFFNMMSGGNGWNGK